MRVFQRYQPFLKVLPVEQASALQQLLDDLLLGIRGQQEVIAARGSKVAVTSGFAKEPRFERQIAAVMVNNHGGVRDHDQYWYPLPRQI